MAGAPPSYEAATGSSSGPSAAEAQHRARNGIPAQRRRSMEDESRSIPTGWLRQYDPESEHQYFVDTRSDPSRSIWHHPYDDEQYLASLTPEELDHVTRLHRSISLQDITAESSDEDDVETAHSTKKQQSDHRKANDSSTKAATLTATTGVSSDEVHGLHRLGRRIKDRLTHTDHKQRVADREKRAQQEQAAYAIHLAARRALARALETGEPQYLCKDKQGRDVYIVPPQGRGVPNGAYGYNPYSQGPFGTPNARYLRPQTPYSRPYGYGYGGGHGFPLLGGFMGGAMLGGLFF